MKSRLPQPGGVSRSNSTPSMANRQVRGLKSRPESHGSVRSRPSTRRLSSNQQHDSGEQRQHQLQVRKSTISAHPSQESGAFANRSSEREERDMSKRGPWHSTDRLSKKFDQLQTGNPFAKGRHDTNFSFVYTQGGVPCRINHGAVHCKLQWDEDPAALDYDPLLVIISEGFRETKHPYVFVSQAAFKELLQMPNAKEKTVPLIAQIVRNIRAAMLSKTEGPFMTALNAIKQLSECVGPALDEHVSAMLIQINKKSFDRKYKNIVFETLFALNQNGGPNIGKIIKAKVPCFTPM